MIGLFYLFFFFIGIDVFVVLYYFFILAGVGCVALEADALTTRPTRRSKLAVTS